MELIEIYKCLCDATRLRLLHLLKQGPLCVCHFQTVLDLPQVAISKHLAYLRQHKLVEAHRRGQWMIYTLPTKRSRHLDLQLQCLQDCVQSYEIFRTDLLKLKKLKPECKWVPQMLKFPSTQSGDTKPAHT